MPELIDWFGNPITIPEKPKPDKNANPCIAAYGAGLDGQKCEGCVHLRYNPRYPTKFWKCDLRRLTHGKGSDHKGSWPACGRYQKREGEYNGG